MPCWLIACIYLIVLMVPVECVAQQFNPASNLSSWYTDRRLIDVELAGTRGVGSEAHLVSPPRVLRLRLERAYVALLIRKEDPPSSVTSIAVDLPTGLPSALFSAPSEQVETQSDPIYQLSKSEWASRTVTISLASSNLADGLDVASSELIRCKGKNVQDDLFLFDKDGARSCFIWSLGSGTKYIAQYSDKTLLLVRCGNALLGCELIFPFEGFLVTIAFNESHLRTWGGVIEKVSEFIQSKQYR